MGVSRHKSARITDRHKDEWFMFSPLPKTLQKVNYIYVGRKMALMTGLTPRRKFMSEATGKEYKQYVAVPDIDYSQKRNHCVKPSAERNWTRNRRLI